MEDPLIVLRAQCTFLDDPQFLSDHPGILDVATFIDGVAHTHRGQGHPYPFFKKLGIESTADYLQAVYRGDEEAVRAYKTVRDTLGFQ